MAFKMRMRRRHTSQSVKWNPGMFNQPLENKNQEIGRKRTDKTSAKQTKKYLTQMLQQLHVEFFPNPRMRDFLASTWLCFEVAFHFVQRPYSYPYASIS